jgi:hypothetical protein
VDNDTPGLRASVTVVRDDHVITAHLFEGAKGQTLGIRDSSPENVANLHRREIDREAKETLQTEPHNVKIEPNCQTFLFKGDSIHGEIIRKLVADNSADGSTINYNREFLKKDTGLEVEQLYNIATPQRVPVNDVSMNTELKEGTNTRPVPSGHIIRRPEDPEMNVKPSEPTPEPTPEPPGPKIPKPPKV